jgi:hypothetical protein
LPHLVLERLGKGDRAIDVESLGEDREAQTPGAGGQVGVQQREPRLEAGCALKGAVHPLGDVDLR